MTIGERIKQRRKELGMSQEELAKKVGFSGKTSISRIERSTGRLQSDIVIKIAKALMMNPVDLMQGSDYHDYVWDYYMIDDEDIRLIDNYHCLTDNARNRLEQYLYDLLRNNENLIPGVEEPYGEQMPRVAKGGDFYEYRKTWKELPHPGDQERTDLFDQRGSSSHEG